MTIVPRICSEPECTESTHHFNSKLCAVHRICQTEGCDKVQSCNRLCKTHYNSQYHQANFEVLSEYQRRWRENNHQKLLDQAKTYRETNRDQVLVCLRDWKTRNPDYASEYLKNNLDKNAGWTRARRARIRGNLVEKYTETQVLDTYGTNCHICLGPIDMFAPRHARSGPGWELGLHIDHLLPIALGGPDTLANVRPSHAICNLAKGGKLVSTVQPVNDL